MKTTKRIISIFVLSAAVFTSTGFACGDMSNGSKCLVDTTTTTTVDKTITTTEKKIPFGFDNDLATFFRNFFGKIFG